MITNMYVTGIRDHNELKAVTLYLTDDTWPDVAFKSRSDRLPYGGNIVYNYKTKSYVFGYSHGNLEELDISVVKEKYLEYFI